MEKWALSICGVCRAQRNWGGGAQCTTGFRGWGGGVDKKKGERQTHGGEGRNEGSGDDFVLVYCLLPS